MTGAHPWVAKGPLADDVNNTEHTSDASTAGEDNVAMDRDWSQQVMGKLASIYN